MAEHNILGARGEEIAARHLLERSLIILEKNWRCRRLEVDIIARSANELVIVEVKSRMEDFLTQPADAVNRKKQEALVRAANYYIRRTGLDLEVRFDIITVIFSRSGTYSVNHIENAFYPALKN
jgi:putative endonuclease